MYKKITATFLVSLILSFFVFEALFKLILQKDLERESRQTNIILENVRDRFRHFLDTPFSIGQVGAEYLGQDPSGFKDYSFLFKKLLEINNDILGINLVDRDGKIIRAFPLEKNQAVLGKVTQNIEELRKSLKKNDIYWLSSPFALYQGQQGFVLYVPIFHQGSLKGWICSVISTQGFVERFRLSRYLNDYNLIIKDKTTDVAYFATAINPTEDARVYSSTEIIQGRELIFSTWKKTDGFSLIFSWKLSLLLALIVAGALAYIRRLIELRKKIKAKLDDIRTLLNHTAKDALNNLIEEQSKLGHASLTHVTQLTHLLEQVELLQMMTKSRRAMTSETQALIPLIENQVQILETVIQRKNLTVTIDSKLSDVTVTVNASLFQNSVLAGILSHSIIHAATDSEISITSEKSEDKTYVTFHTKSLTSDNSNSLKVDRRMDVAHKVLSIYDGELYMQRDLSEGMIIRMVLPN